MIPSYEMSGIIFTSLQQPCCYGWKRNNKFLYIGKTKNGIIRLQHHHVINKKDKVLNTDIFVFWYTSEKLIHQLEINLLVAHKPLFNAVETYSIVLPYVPTTKQPKLKLNKPIRERVIKVLPDFQA